VNEFTYSSWADGVRTSDINSILEASKKPGILSLAGGVPYPASYPTDMVAEVANALVRREPEIVFPYPDPQGTPRIRESVAYRMKKRGVSTTSRNIVMTSGSQHASDMLFRLIMNPGDTMIIEAPTFLGVLDSIKYCGYNLVEVPIDENGIRTDLLANTLSLLNKKGTPAKLIYLMSNYHNPAGVMISQERRHQIAALAREYNCLIVEDDAYSELQYDPDVDQTPIKAYDTDDHIIYLGSFSKLVAPGFRVGWAVAGDELVDTWNQCRPMFDVGSPALNQEIIAELHEDNWLDQHIEALKSGYRSRRNAMLAALAAYMPEGVTWTDAHGGFYVWVTTPAGLDHDMLFQTAIKNRVTYFTGNFFYLDNHHHDHFRLCFSRQDEDAITEAVKRIGAAIKEEMARR
jgi:2-aminoadipate transaminase